MINMAVAVAQQIYEEVRAKNNPHVLEARLDELQPEFHRSYVAKFVLEQARKEGRLDMTEVAEPYAAQLINFKPSR
jgi:hypothetical protein